MNETRGFFFPVVFPFRRRDWFDRLWWVALLDYVPFFNLILLRGWRLSLVRRLAWGCGQPMPPPDILRFLRRGLFLWTMTAGYTLVPLAIVIALGIGGLPAMLDDLHTLFAIATGQSSMTFWQFVRKQIIETVAALGIELAWVALSIPLHRAATIRFAVTGRYRSFFEIPANFAFLAAKWRRFLALYWFSLVVSVLIGVAAAILAGTVIGILFLPSVTLPLYYWSTGYEFGELATDLRGRLYPEGAPPERLRSELSLPGCSNVAAG